MSAPSVLLLKQCFYPFLVNDRSFEPKFCSRRLWRRVRRKYQRPAAHFCGSFVLFWDVGHDGRSSGKRLSCQMLSKCTKKGSFTVWVAAQALTFSSNPYCCSSVCSAMLLLFCCLCLTVKHCSAVNVDMLYYL